MTNRLEMSPERMIEALNNEIRLRDVEIERLRQRDGFIQKLDEQIIERNIEIERLRTVMANAKDELARLRKAQEAHEETATKLNSYINLAGDQIDEIERLRVENIQMRFALGYPMPSHLEHHVIPENPFKCGTCDAKAKTSFVITDEVDD